MDAKEDLIKKLEWNNNIANLEEKEILARKIASKVKNGDVISFGSGTTSFLAVKEIGNKCKKENINIVAIPTSEQIKLLCDYLEIKTANLEDYQINWGFDGADEVDDNKWMIKGLGGAMYREKLNIKQAPKTYILIDKTKKVKKLGEYCPVPVECDIDKCDIVERELNKLGAVHCKIRENNDTVFVTDNGKYIIDAKFNSIDENLENKINEIEGVLENGLFINYKNIEIVEA